MRLIDLDAYCDKHCGWYVNGECKGYHACGLELASTAYVVDEVIEELKSKAFTAGEESNDAGCYTDGRFSAVPLDVAIEIVKRGGV